VKLVPAAAPAERRAFHAIPRRVYRNLPGYRATEDALTHMLVDGPTVFHNHAEVTPFLLVEDDDVVGRCALVHDSRMPDVVQVAFFDALPGLTDVCHSIRTAARAFRPGAGRLVIGLNGHLNYGAGFLLSRFDVPPVFGLPYTPCYYADYFASLDVRATASYRFPVAEVFAWAERQPTGTGADGIAVRSMDLRRLQPEIELYTALDNASFIGTPYWSPRDPQENYELFAPFRAFLSGDNLLFAEIAGRPIGFLLWYPDFNELVGPGGGLNAWQALRFRLGIRARTFRVTEIAILPEFRRNHALYAMILHVIPILRAGGFTHGEGGFIFERNRASINMTSRYLDRVFGRAPEPYRRYGIFEGPL
jgi:hypothetical protein